MKEIIDIPEELYNNIDRPVGDEDWLRYIIKRGTPLPDNATNGDVIKTLFPNATIKMKVEHGSSGWKFSPQIVVEFSETERNYFDEVWWNAPYKEQKNGNDD